MSSADSLEPRGRPSRSQCAPRQRRLLRDIRDARTIPSRPFPLWAKTLIGLGAIALATFVVNSSRRTTEVPEGPPILRQSIPWDALPPRFQLLRSDPAIGSRRGRIDTWCRITPRAYVFHLFDPYDSFSEGRLDSLLETDPNLGLPENAVVTLRQATDLGIPDVKASFSLVQFVDVRDGSSNRRVIGTGRRQRVIYEAITAEFDEDECARIMRAVFESISANDESRRGPSSPNTLLAGISPNGSSAAPQPKLWPTTPSSRLDSLDQCLPWKRNGP